LCSFSIIFHPTFFELVIIDDLDLVSVAIEPFETDTPLVVDPDAVLAGSIGLQPVPGWKPEVDKTLGVVQHPQFPACHILNIAGQPADGLALPDLFGAPVLEGSDHRKNRNAWRYMTSRVMPHPGRRIATTVSSST
jgi:hypothetical protein